MFSTAVNYYVFCKKCNAGALVTFNVKIENVQVRTIADFVSSGDNGINSIEVIKYTQY